jgi:DNA-directed RNA polymerase specialized sigma24 family protein
MHVDYASLVDERGQPFNARLGEALQALVPRLQRDFPALTDPAVITEVLEMAGRRIVARERRLGSLESSDELRVYAWVTVRRIAAARLQHSSNAVARGTLGSERSMAILAATPSRTDTPERIEAEVLLSEVMARLTDQDRDFCALKLDGYSTKEIADRRSMSTSRVDTLFFRLGQKLRNLSRGGAPHARRQTQEMRRTR